VPVDGIEMSQHMVDRMREREFDLMARIAGLQLRNRWGGWDGEPFGPASWRHISVYERAT
jgi:hypothetical protein